MNTDDRLCSNRPLTAILEARERGDVKVLTEALSDTDRDVRVLAAGALRRLGAPEALGALGRLARDSNDEVLRLLAIKSIGAAGGGSEVSTLHEIASHGNPIDVRVTAISVLIDLGDERAVPLLLDLVQSEDLTGSSKTVPHARSSWRWALRELVELSAADGASAIERVLPRLGFRDRRFAHRIIRHLQRIASD